MELQLFVAVNAMTISALLIAVTLIYRPADHADWLVANAPWIGVNALVLAVGLLALAVVPSLAGTLVALVFLPLVVAPSFLFMRSQRAQLNGHVRLAAYLAGTAALLHPTKANLVNARLAWAQSGTEDQNVQALSVLVPKVPREYRPLVEAQLAAAKRDWPEVLARTGLSAPGDASLKGLEIRALAETGKTDAMVVCYKFCKASLGTFQLAMPRLLVMAFGGRPRAVEALMSHTFAAASDEMKAYWIAVGHLNTPSDTAAGEYELAKLAAQAKDDRIRGAAHRRLAAFGAAPQPARAPSTERELDVIAGQILYPTATPARSISRVLPVTLGLILLNVSAFIAEIVLGGSEDSDTLISLGALWPPMLLEQGEWWRLITATFLHFGVLHIASNMFVLWVLGRILEPMLGSLRTLIIYLVGGVISSAFVLWLMASGATNYGLLVGASGAIFALLGAEAAIVLLQWRRDPANFDRRKLTTLAVMLGLQVAIDLSVPNVSFAAHASGFIAGILGALALPLRTNSRTRFEPRSGANS